MRLRGLFVIGLCVALVTAAGPAQASVAIRTMVAFDPAAGEFPEGLAVDKQGNIDVSLINPVGEIRQLRRDGAQSVLAHFSVPGFGPLGLAIDAAGHMYAAVASFDAATQGVYRVFPGGTSARIPGTGGIAFPNGLAFDKRGNLYATDSIGGSVWRIPKSGPAVLWAQSPLLEGNGSLQLGFPLGANGIGFRHGALIVANTEGGSLVSIPIESDGSPGPAAVVAEGPDLFGADGIALGVHGNIYVAVNAQSTLLRVAPNGSETLLATAANGLQNPASLSFGTGQGQRKTLFMTNFAFFAPPGTARPAILAAPVGEPGQPVP
jgi:hypothetical protein